MNRVVKFAVLPLACIVVVVGAIAVYIAATFDPNRYKPYIEQAVKNQLGRTIRLEGDIKLSLFPGIGVTLGKIWLSERSSDQEFGGVEDIRIALKLRPLLSRQIVIDTVEIKNLRANVVRTSDGKINIDDLTGGGEVSSEGLPVTVDIDHLALRNAAITYIDQAQDTRYTLSKLDLETGHLASGVPSKIELSFVLQSDKPKLDLTTALKTTITFDLGRRVCTLQGLDLASQGLAAGFSDLSVKAKGDVEARAADQEISISKLSLVVSGKQDGGELNVKLEAPAFKVAKEQVSGEGIALDAAWSKRSSKMVMLAKLAVPALAVTGQAFKANASTATLDLQQEGTSIKAKAVSPWTGSVDTQRIELSKLVLAVRVNNPKLLRQPVEATLSGDARADFANRTVAVAFAARIDASSVNGKAELTKFAPPYYTFDVHIDQLDADKYLPQRDQPDEPFDLATLKDLNASGTLRIGVLTLAGIKATNVRVDVKSADGQLEVGAPAANRNTPADRRGRVIRKKQGAP